MTRSTAVNPELDGPVTQFHRTAYSANPSRFSAVCGALIPATLRPPVESNHPSSSITAYFSRRGIRRRTLAGISRVTWYNIEFGRGSG